MKILHVSYYDAATGSGIALNRLHSALKNAGADSRILCVKKTLPGNDSSAVSGPERLRMFFAQRISAQILRMEHSTSAVPRSLNLFPGFSMRKIRQFHPDVIHLHWPGGEMFSPAQIAELAHEFPLVWTLHDCWAFLGAAHYPDTANSVLESWMLRRKRHAFRDFAGIFTAPSQWMADQLKQSSVFPGRQAEVIPNTLDLDTFSPSDKASVKSKLGLDPQKKILLFGATSLSTPVKGFAVLQKTLELLKTHPEIQPVSFGAGIMEGMRSFGTVREPERLAEIYRAADVFVCPSLQDNLPNTVVEAQACGTAAAAFRTGGLPEIIQHGKTGFLAEPFDPQSLADSALECLEKSAILGEEARKQAVLRYAPSIVAEAFLRVYEKAHRSFM